MSATAGMTKPTGWHYHVCDGQFVYVLRGWVDLEFEDGRKLRVQDGESLYIPGGCDTTRRGVKDLSCWKFPCPRTWARWPAIRPRGWSPRA
jgi:hypothetical protein